MKSSPVETLFKAFDDTATVLKDELSISYLEALVETGENIFQGEILQSHLSELSLKRLRKTYESLRIDDYSSEEIRKSFQLAILKGMKENIQPNHQMTPDGVGMLVGYLVNKFVQEKSFRLLDPAVGSGNLLTTVMNLQHNKDIEGIGIDIDDLLIRLAYVNANLQQHSIHLFNQDSLEQLFIEPVDAVVCDLPVGYYPNDLRAKEFELSIDEGHSFAHHLFIEQSIRHTNEDGYLFFIIPNGLFESDQAKKLHDYFSKHVYIQGIIQLPLSMFKNKDFAKSILILQKKGKSVKKPKQVLLVQMPSMSNMSSVEKIVRQIDEWIKENK